MLGDCYVATIILQMVPLDGCHGQGCSDYLSQHEDMHKVISFLPLTLLGALLGTKYEQTPI